MTIIKTFSKSKQAKTLDLEEKYDSSLEKIEAEDKRLAEEIDSEENTISAHITSLLSGKDEDLGKIEPNDNESMSDMASVTIANDVQKKMLRALVAEKYKSYWYERIKNVYNIQQARKSH